MSELSMRSEFVFALCQCGAERALKRDLASRHPELRAAFQRPGLVTFRGPEQGPDVQLGSPLARAWGLSLGTHPDPASVSRALDALALASPVRLHVTPREHEDDREEASGVVERSAARTARIALELRSLRPALFHDDTAAQLGDTVVDVVVGEQEEPLLLGLHTHDRSRSPHPGGRYVYEVPPEAPSRAYRKIEEAIRAFELPLRVGDRALELGSAPGGASLALLRRGVSVIGVDPAAMNAGVLAFEGPAGARLQHLQQPMNAVSLEQLPREVHWLLLDVHLAPQVAMRQVSRFLSHYKRTLLGAVLTLKLNDWSFYDQLPRFSEEARQLGLLAPLARQLPAHRQELALAGLTKLGHNR